MDITFVLPGLTRQPVGGYQVVYQYANFFTTQGHNVNIVHVRYSPHDTRRGLIARASYRAKRTLLELGIIEPWFKLDPRIHVSNFDDWQSVALPAADVIIATAWDTANIVQKAPKSAGSKFYFIQHLETWDDSKLVIETWHLPLKKIVIASWLLEYAKRIGETAHLVRNFVDPNVFYYQDDLTLRPKTVSMLYSRYPIKGSDVGLKALYIAHRAYPELRAILFGTGAEPSGLPEYIQYIRGEKGDQLREHVYSRSSVYLFPSQTEGWGLTATEAMSTGCALVSTANGGVNDFGIQGKTALISHVGDSEALAKNLVFLLKNDTQRIKLAKNGSSLLQTFTIENSANEFLRILRSR